MGLEVGKNFGVSGNNDGVVANSDTTQTKKTFGPAFEEGKKVAKNIQDVTIEHYENMIKALKMKIDLEKDETKKANLLETLKKLDQELQTRQMIKEYENEIHKMEIGEIYNTAPKFPKD